MFYVTTQPTFYRPSHCYSRPRRAFAQRPSYRFWQPFEEPSIVWVIQRPVDDKVAPTTTAQLDTKPDAVDDNATVVHRNTAATADDNKSAPSATLVPRTTTTANDQPFVVQVKLPHGMTAHNLQVRVQSNVLYITGEQRVVSNNLVRTTSFARQFPVDATVDTDKVSAVINTQGVLVVTAPKKPAISDKSKKSEQRAKVTFSETPTSYSSSEVPSAPASTEAAEPETKTSTSTEVAEADTKPAATESKPAPTDVAQPPVLVPFKLQVSQNDDKVFAVTVELPPGVNANDLDLQVKKDILSISGEQRKEYNGGSVFTSKFVRHFSLDKSAEVDKIQATLNDQTRTLTVTVPKKAVVEPAVQKIAIQVGGYPLPAEGAKEESGEPVSKDMVEQTPGDAREDKTLDESASTTESKDESWTSVEKASEDAEQVTSSVEAL